MTTTTPSRSTSIRYFVRHFLEMVAAMVAGMAVLEPLWMEMGAAMYLPFVVLFATLNGIRSAMPAASIGTMERRTFLRPFVFVKIAHCP